MYIRTKNAREWPGKGGNARIGGPIGSRPCFTGLQDLPCRRQCRGERWSDSRLLIAGHR